jgi:hypothetical protein
MNKLAVGSDGRDCGNQLAGLESGQESRRGRERHIAVDVMGMPPVVPATAANRAAGR